MANQNTKKYFNSKIAVLASVVSLGLHGCAGVQRSPNPSEVTPVDGSSELTEVQRQSLTTLPSAEGAETQASHHFSLAQSYSLEGNVDRAIEEYKMALVYDPQSEVIHTRLATEYVKKGLITFAIEECKAAIKANDKYSDARLLLAGLLGATKMSDEALREYDTVLGYEKNEEALKEVYVFKASLLLEMKKGDQALATLKKLISSDPDSFLGHFYLAKAYQQLGKGDKAVESYKKALELKPSFSQAAVGLAQYYEEKHKSEEALKVYIHFFEESRDLQIAVKIAQTLIEQNHYKQALKYLTFIEQSDPDNMNVKVKIGLIYSEMKDYPRAVKAFRDILEKNPDSEKVRMYLGSAYAELQQYDKAIEVLSPISSESASYGEVALHIGYLYRLKGDVPLALEWLDKAIHSNPDYSPYYSLKASLLEESRGIPEAISMLEDVKGKFSGDEKLLYYLGTLYDKTKQVDKALGVMKEILQINSESASALNYVGYTLAVRGESLDNAERLIRQALALQPKDGYVQDSLGFVLLKRGKIKDAVVELEKAHKLKPDEPVIVEHLADAYILMNLKSKALQKYIEASKLYTDPAEKATVERKINEIKGRKTASTAADVVSKEVVPTH